MYVITGNCQGFITCVVYKDQLLISEFEEIIRGLNDHIKDHKLYVLSDLRDAKLSLDPGMIYEMERINRETRAPGLTIFEAIVVSDPLEEKVSQFFERTRVPINHSIKVFSSQDEAVQWLHSYQYSFF